MSRIGAYVHDARTSLGTVFGNANLRRVILAFGGSAIGDWAYGTAIMVWAYGVGGVTAVGIWATLRLVLVAIVAPFASTLADRFSRKSVMVGADLSRAVLVLVAAVLITVDAPALTVFVVATVASLTGTPFRPALAALMPRLAAEPAELTAANGAVSTLESVAFFVGPAIGALLLGFTSVQVVILFNALTFLWSAALVVRVHESSDGAVADAGDDEDEDQNSRDESFLTESMAGFKEIGRRRDLLLVTGIYAAQTLVAGASFVFGLAIAVEMTPFGARGVGYLDAAMGVGAVLGGVVAIARANRQRLAADFSVGVLFWAIPLILVAVWPHTGTALAAMAITGVANPVVDVNASTIIQRMTPDEVLGRVFGALESALIIAMALGSLVMPYIISAVGLRWSLVVLAGLMLLVVVPTWPRVRRIDTTLREPEGLALVEQSALFAPLERKSLELIAGQLQRVEVPAGEVLIAEGEPGDRFYLVESGQLRVTFAGRELGVAQRGEPIGEIALLRDVPRTATVTAVEPSVVLALDRADFLNAVTGNSEVNNRADDLISRRIPTY
jgi:MFS family permease